MKKKHPLRALLINVIGVALAFGLLFLAVRGNRAQIREVFSHGVDGRLFALAFAIYMLGLLMTFGRWYVLVRVVEPRFRLRDAFLLGFIGNLWNLVVPGAVGGDFFKAAFLSRMQIKRTQAIASMVIDRIVGLLGLFLLAGIAGIVAWPRAPREVCSLIVIVWIALACGFAARRGDLYPGTHPAQPGGFLEGHGRRALILRELRELSIAYRARLALVGGTVLLSSVTHGMSVIAFYTVSKAMFPSGIPTLAQHFLMVPLTLFTTAVPLPFGALGLSGKRGAEAL